MFLIEKFQQFHSELLRLKARVGSGAWVFQGDDTNLGESAAKDSPTAVWRRLSSLLDRQAMEAGGQGGGFAVELYKRAQYAMVALADETFLSLEWPGRDLWRKQLLETKFFGTHVAGEAIFERIDELLRDRDSLRAELGRVYLMILGLGFQGRYRGQPDAEERIAIYRRNLYRFIFNQDPVTLKGDQYVIPQAYAATLDEAVSTELPYLRPWIFATFGALLLWVGGTFVVWRLSTNVLRPAMTRITTGEAKEQKEEATQGASADDDGDGDGADAAAATPKTAGDSEEKP